MHIFDNDAVKLVRSMDYNYNFDRNTGVFMRWGKTVDDDPQMAPGPELADIEISVGNCSSGLRCLWCYKSNTPANGRHMTLDTFKIILAKLTQIPILTQVALGITDVDANPDLIPIMMHCRDNGVVPNFTTAGYGMTRDLAAQLVPLAGAIAVSAYPHNLELCYDTVEMLTAIGLKQTNIHLLYHDGNQEHVYRVLRDVKTDRRLRDLNAVVLLALKQRGRAKNGFQVLTDEKFNRLVAYCFDNGIRVGFDSCSAPRFTNWAVRNLDEYKSIEELIEPCESGIFSVYCDVDGYVWPCSFTEGLDGWKPINLLDVESFSDEVWNSKQMKKWRDRLLRGGRSCPVYEV